MYSNASDSSFEGLRPHTKLYNCIRIRMNMKKRIRLIGLLCWVSSMIVFIGLAVLMNKIGDRLPIYQTLAGIWLGDILFGIIAFLVFIASFASLEKKIDSEVPHVMSKSRLGRTLLLVSIALVLLIFGGGILAISFINRNSKQVSSPTVAQINAGKLIEVINSWETSQGYKPYVVDDTLCAIASKRVSELSSSFENAINLQGYDEGGKNFSNMAENITKDFSSEQSILDAWVNNPVTKKNLTDYFVNSCVRCENSLCVQVLGNKKDSVILSKQEGSINANTDSSIKVNQINNSVYDGTCKQIDDKTTRCNNAPDSRMSTADELFVAVNNFRVVHNLNPVQKDDTLCYIAQSRANEMKALGQLDEHQGLNKFFDEQNIIQNIGEVLYGSKDSAGQPTLGVHVVEWGWARSVTGHREALLDPKWQYGCGGIGGYIAVFEFGIK